MFKPTCTLGHPSRTLHVRPRRLPPDAILPVVVLGHSREVYALTTYESALGSYVSTSVRPTDGATNTSWHSCVRRVKSRDLAVAYLQINAFALT